MPGPNDGFSAEVERSFPFGLVLPDAIRRTLAWLEENGCVHPRGRRGGRYASLYPGPQEATGTSCVGFHPVDPGHAAAWIGRGVPGAERLAPFVRTGGDGSYAALWLDPSDTPRFVHMGSGSGSTWAGVITDDPVALLRFLAIGYPEPCWPEQFDETPLEVHAASDLCGEAAFVPPLGFQDWLGASFGVTIPARASEIVRHAPDMDDEAATDPFLAWLHAMQAAAEAEGSA